ncbi:MAG TPA: ATP-dependent sacrificial sulfur transferase LarE [Bacillota bacterium]|nr:ATP-dependent sacrificial sulfur transferase LarE [Bacillota bacterium]
MDKLEALQNLIQTFPSALVAYSGGVDSTFLAVVVHRVLGERMLAVTAFSPTYPETQLSEAKDLAAQFGFPLQVITTHEFDDPEFINNPPERCYFCKLALFRELQGIADEKGLGVLLDGANQDDLADYRPGHRAAQEMKVRSPLREVGLTKAEIRELSKKLGLPTWQKPAYACLASRIPYGQPITTEALARIDQAESFLASLGFQEIRVRDHFPVARLEISKNDLEGAWKLRKQIAEKLHEFGFPYVTIDLDGFRSGSMNEIIGK